MMRMLALVLLIFAAGCGAAPTAPTPPGAPGPIAFAGQSNANLMFDTLTAAYAPGVVLGAAARNPGSRIQEWALGAHYWPLLTPSLHQPLRAFVWWQGESDRAEVAEYPARLAAFLASVRAEAGDPQLFVVLCRVVDDPVFAGIRAVQEAYVRSDPRSVLVSSDGLELEGPGSAHLSPVGYRAMAARVLVALP